MNVTQPPLFGFGKVILCTGDGGLKMLAVRPEGAGDVTKTNIVWKYRKIRAVAVVADSRGRSTLFRQRIGNSVVYRGQNRRFRLATAAGRFVLGVADLRGRPALLFDNEGTSTVGEIGRTWKKLAVNRLDDGCMASPAVAGKALFIRTRTHLYRIEKNHE